MTKNFLTIDELQALLEVYQVSNPGQIRNSLGIFLVACHTGLSLKALLTLKFEHLLGNSIRKSGIGRNFINKKLPENLVGAIRSGEDSDYLFMLCGIKTINSDLLEITSLFLIGRKKRISFYSAKFTYINLLISKT